MRRVLWLSVGFSAACGASIWLLPERWLIPAALLLAFLTIVLSCFRKYMGIQIPVLILLGAVMGFGWTSAYSHFYLLDAASLDEQTLPCEMVISNYSFDTDYGTGADALLTLDGKQYRVRAYFNGKASFAPGDQIDGTFLFRYTAGRNEKYAYHSGNGIFLLAYQRGDIAVVKPKDIPLRFYPSAMAKNLSDTISRIFPGDTAPFAKALVLGDTSDISYETDTALKLSGIRHVVAVSGLHISILYAFLSLITLKNKWLSSLISVPVLIFFTAMAGFTPSVTRACIMCCIMAVGKLADREYDNITSLAAAVFVMIVLNPGVVLSVGFQLSVVSVAGIFLFYNSFFRWLLKHCSKLGKRIAASIAVSVSASILTTPLCAAYFGVVSLVSVITNLLTLWVIGFIFCGIVFACLLSVVWYSGAAIAAAAVSLAIRYVLVCARLLSSSPFAAVYTQSNAVVIWLVCCYILSVIFLICGKKYPQVYCAVSTAGLCTALLVSWLVPLHCDTVLSVLDVGQGQSILIQNDKKTILVDCGGDTDEDTADIVAQTLLSRGISYLDAVIITHCDTDHAGGLPYLLTRIKTQGVFYPSAEELPELPADILLFPVSEDHCLSYGDTTMKLFSSGSADSGNETSLCVLFESKSCDILITGDRSALGERLLMKRTQLPQVDILIAGHHGAKDSTSEELLDTVKPDTVIISVGADNRYGHPSEEVLARLEAAACTVYRTDLDGTITIRR